MVWSIFLGGGCEFGLTLLFFCFFFCSFQGFFNLPKNRDLLSQTCFDVFRRLLRKVDKTSEDVLSEENYLS